MARLYPDHFALKPPPYEYEFERPPINLVLGDEELWPRLAAGESVMDLEEQWQPELADFDQLRRDYLLY